MMNVRVYQWSVVALVGLLTAGCQQSSNAVADVPDQTEEGSTPASAVGDGGQNVSNLTEPSLEKIERTDDEWRKLLTEEQYLRDPKTRDGTSSHRCLLGQQKAGYLHLHWMWAATVRL